MIGLLPIDMQIFRITVFSIWTTAIISTWTVIHFQNSSDPWWFLLSPLLFLPLLFGGIIFLFRKRPSWRMKISPIMLIGFVVLLSFLLLNFAGFLRISPLSHERVLPFDFWLTAQGGFLMHLTFLVATLSLSGLSLYLTGHFIFRTLFRSISWNDSHPAFLNLWKIALGMFGWVLISFTLGIWGILSPPLILFLVCGIVWIERKQLPIIWRWLTAPLLTVRTMDRVALTLLLFCLFAASLGLVDAIRPIPTGYDDMTFYMNRVNLIVSRQALVPGGSALPFELLVATVQTAIPFDGLLSGMSFGVLCLLLGGYLMYSFGKSLLSEKVGLLAAALWMSLPMTSALFLREVKPDILLFFIAGLSFWSWIQWTKERDIHLFFQTAFLFGFAISIKYTALFLGGAFALGYIWEKWHSEIKMSLSLRTILLALSFAALPLLPWLGYNLASYPADQKFQFDSLTQSASPHPIFSEASWKKFGINPKTMCQSTGIKEEFARFHFHHSYLLRILETPWGMTMNTRLGYFATEIGFLFLVILPIFLFLPRQKGNVSLSHMTKQFSILTALAIGYFTLWFLLAESIPWYGFPGFFLLILLVAMTPFFFSKQSTLCWILSLILFLGLNSNLALRLKFSLSPALLQYSSTQLDETSFIETLFPGFSPVYSLVNQEKRAGILIAGSGIRYFINDNDRRVLADPTLDTFACLNRENDPSLTRERLRSLGIRYLYLSADRFTPELQAQYPSLKEKGEDFLGFAKSALTLRFRTPLGLLYEVPDKGSE